MSSKVQASLKQPIIFDGLARNGDGAGVEPELLGALDTNIRESLDEIDILRGTIQYWESRPPVTGPEERDRLLEAFRIMHGELLGLTVRVKALLDRAGPTPGL
jgi:hypothetical protein